MDSRFTIADVSEQSASLWAAQTANRLAAAIGDQFQKYSSLSSDENHIFFRRGDLNDWDTQQVPLYRVDPAHETWTIVQVLPRPLFEEVAQEIIYRVLHKAVLEDVPMDRLAWAATLEAAAERALDAVGASLYNVLRSLLDSPTVLRAVDQLGKSDPFDVGPETPVDPGTWSSDRFVGVGLDHLQKTIERVCARWSDPKARSSLAVQGDDTIAVVRPAAVSALGVAAPSVPSSKAKGAEAGGFDGSISARAARPRRPV
jgi:hypothetical protein